MTKPWASKRIQSLRGFTIVELLIVIVVIAILAAISIVAYTGIQDRAELASIQSLIKSATQQLEVHAVEAEVYPSAHACPTTSPTQICIDGGAGIDITYAAFVPGGNYPATMNHSYSIAALGDRQFVYQSNAVRTGSREFMTYVDIAPIIDRYGLQEYRLEFDIKSADTSRHNIINAYLQNGSGARYSFNKSVPVTTSYTHHNLTFTPSEFNMTLTQAWLAFYGTYDTGNIPTVKNVKMSLVN